MVLALRAGRATCMTQVTMGQPDLPDTRRRLDLDLERHLRFTATPIDKVNWSLPDAVFEAMRQVRRLDLKDIAFRLNAAKRQAAQRLRSPEPVARCNIPHWASARSDAHKNFPMPREPCARGAIAVSTLPPAVYREPKTTSQVSRYFVIVTRVLGSCEKSASIWHTASTLCFRIQRNPCM